MQAANFNRATALCSVRAELQRHAVLLSELPAILYLKLMLQFGLLYLHSTISLPLRNMQHSPLSFSLPHSSAPILCVQKKSDSHLFYVAEYKFVGKVILMIPAEFPWQL